MNSYFIPNNIIQYFIYSFIICYIIDSLLLFSTGEKGRWFKLHGCYNMLIVGLCFNDIISMISNPSSGFDTVNIFLPGVYSTTIHIYHCIYFKLKCIDYYHHILSVFAPCLIVPFINQSRYVNLYFFILTGLPGGLDYFGLCFYKYNIITKLQQKYISSILNSYIRIPGGIISVTYTILDIKNVSNIQSTISMYIISFIVYFNVTYFGKMAIENYGENIYFNKNLKIKNK